MDRYDVITFDCYGTLIDWERGIADAFVAEAARAGRSLVAADVVAAYSEVEPEVEAGPYRNYREVLNETAVRVAARLGWSLPRDRAPFLTESLPAWRPFPDTNPALRRLAASGMRLGILSNVDEDLLAGTRRLLEVEFDLVVTAEQVRSYKPAPSHFQTARRRLDPNARWLHAAQSYFHDVVPAKTLGIPVAWINRKEQAIGSAGPPDYEVRNLIELAALVIGE